MKCLCLLAFLITVYTGFGQQQPVSTLIPLDEKFHKATEISSIALVGDSLYMPVSKCGTVFIGHVASPGTNFREQYIGNRNTEGLAYYNGYFYLSDDKSSTITRFNKTFDQPPVEHRIKWRKTDDHWHGNDGFEGIAVINDSIFYILLERKNNADVSVLYKGVLKKGKIVIHKKMYLTLDAKSRYCDLFFTENRLFLLKSTFYEYNCAPLNNYEIRCLDLDSNNDIVNGRSPMDPPLFLSLTSFMEGKCRDYSRNVEGITRSKDGDWYIVSDNFNGNPKSCSDNGQQKTLLMRIDAKQRPYKEEQNKLNVRQALR